MAETITVTETIESDGIPTINNPILNGLFLSKFRENMLIDEKEETVDHILSNSIQSINFFSSPHNTEPKYWHQPMKILCLGKVQSGKTSFFLGSIALAFDNGYNVAYLLGGTKLRLKKQNLGRVTDAFKNNEKVKIIDVTKGFNEDIQKYIDDGFKLILVILKNAAKKTNLGTLKSLSEAYSSTPAVIIDDEGDEYTPGNPKSKTKAGNKTHDKIVDTIKNFNVCTFLTVTATPQANLLISTMDGISPDRLVLVQPGKGYTGGIEFFDNIKNPHVLTISDSDDFESSIPDTFEDALYFFIFACALKRSQNDIEPFSMLVHPSSFNAVQSIVASRIETLFKTTILEGQKDKKSILWSEFCDSIKSQFEKYVVAYPNCTTLLSDVLNQLDEVLNNFEVQTINYTNGDYGDEKDKNLYKVKVGGNMLGRGLTIDRLIVSYIYRDSKEPAVDTMYQRCRWFGYKRKYFDVCKVYMTETLRYKFIAIVDHETQMWIAMDAFLNTQINIKKFKRLFSLNNDDLVLTRKSVSRTVVLKVISSGNKADEFIDITKAQRQNNIGVYTSFYNKYAKDGSFVDFDNSKDHKQEHLLITMKFTTLFDDFLSKINFAEGSPFDINVFSKLIEEINKGHRKDEILVMVMRPNIYEERSSASAGNTISRLFQGRNDGTEFTGDRYPTDISGKEYKAIPFIQIHMIKLDGDLDRNHAFPLISLNNPYTDSTIKMVTGDNNYDD